MTIQDALDQAKAAILKITADKELHALEEIGINPEHRAVVTVLSLAGVIQTTQGTGRVYFADPADGDKQGALERLGVLLGDLEADLRAKPGQIQTKAQVVEKMLAKGFPDDDYPQIVSLLSLCDLAISAGRGRAGGIQLYEAQSAAQQIQDAADEIRKGGDYEARVKRESDHEAVLYPAAAKFVSERGYQAVILGNRKRLPGEWNTPDILGYRINRLTVLGGSEVEVITVEVKWSISKLAIAEASSHQRLSNRSFLMVNEELDSIDDVHLTDLHDKGIGLVCLKAGQPVIHSAAKLSNATRKDVDDFLKNALDPEAKEVIKDEIAKSLGADTLGRLLNPR
jgi:uncharacterized protein (DUF1778 family)